MKKYSLSNIEKQVCSLNILCIETTFTHIQRLYFTADGIAPFLQVRHLANGYIQRNQVVVGLIYSFTITTNHTGKGKIEFNFIVSRDRNKEFHIFKQTSVHSSSGRPWGCDGPIKDACINTALFLSLPSLPPPISSARLLKVASYNIWNVNGLPDKDELYKDRLERLGKVFLNLW